jgi:hypothetical protein
MTIEPPRGATGYTVMPERVTLTVSARRSLLAQGSLDDIHVHWIAPVPLEDFVGRRVGLRRVGDLPDGVRVRMEPDSVMLRRAPPS